MNSNYDQTKIEAQLEEIVKTIGISTTVYVGSRPQTVNEKVADFVVVKMVGTLEDLNAYGRTKVSFDLFAKELAGGYKNTKKLSAMYQKLIGGVDYEYGDFMLSGLHQLPDAPDDAGFTVRMTQTNLLIKPKTN